MNRFVLGLILLAGLAAAAFLLLQSGALATVLSSAGKEASAASLDSGEDSALSLPFVETTVLKFEAGATVPREFTGTLKSTRSSEPGFKRTGRLVAIHAAEGDSVPEGMVLAELDTESLTASLDELKAQREGARALLAELVAGPRMQTIEAARTQVADFQAQVELARIDFRRQESLKDSGAISLQEFDDSRLRLASAEERQRGAEQRLAELVEGTRKEQVQVQMAELTRIEAAMERVAVDLKESVMISPYSAVIARKMFDEGSIIPMGTPVFRIVERDSQEVWIGLAPEMVEHLDREAWYPVLAANEQILARFKRALPELDSVTRTRTVIFEVRADASPSLTSGLADEPLISRIPVGQIVRMSLPQPVSQTGFWLPVKALARGQRGLWSAFVVQSLAADSPVQSSAGRMEVVKREVEILQVDSARALVRGALSEGERVVVSGTHRLTAGQLVRLVSPSVATSDEDDPPVDGPAAIKTPTAGEDR